MWLSWIHAHVCTFVCTELCLAMCSRELQLKCAGNRSLSWMSHWAVKGMCITWNIQGRNMISTLNLHDTLFAEKRIKVKRSYAFNETNLIHYLSSVNSVTLPLHVSSLLVAYHQEVTMCICNKWYVFYWKEYFFKLLEYLHVIIKCETYIFTRSYFIFWGIYTIYKFLNLMATKFYTF
jgi:hypothetical protein